MSKPDLWTVLRNDEDGGVALVVPEGTTPVDALLTLLEEEYGGERFAPDNPAVVKAAEGLRIEVWHSCTKAWCEAELIDGQGYTGWWAPHGDGKQSIHVLNYDGDIYGLGEAAVDAAASESTAS